MSCGHTFCENCLNSLLSKTKTQNRPFSCPTCQTIQDIKDENDIKKLIKNFVLLRIAEKVGERKTTLAQIPQNNSIIYDTKQTLDNQDQQVVNDSFLNSSIVISNINSVPTLKSGFIVPKNEQENNAKAGFNFDFEKKCTKHGLPIHSYAIGTSKLFCDTCISETNLKTAPLPNVISEIKRLIDKNEVKACLIKNEIEKIEIFFEKYISEFKRTNTAKIEHLFNYLYGLIRFFHNDAQQLLYQCIQEQKSQISSKLSQLKDLNEEVSSMEKQLVEIHNLKESEILHSINKVKKIQHKLTNFINYNLQFDLFSFNIGINKDKKEQLISAIKDAYHLEVDFLEIQNEPPSIKKILSLGEYWQCICGQLSNSFSDVKCTSCGLYRRVETIPNLFINPEMITDEDAKFIHARRKEEAGEFQVLLKQSAQSDKYYVIDIEWYLKWKCFVTNDMTEKYLKKENLPICNAKNVGVLPPGPVDNLPLLDKNENGEFSLKKGLQKKKDYIIIGELVWDFFALNYNGGPAIILNNNDNIYASFQKTNNCEYQSYSSIKELFVEEPSEKKLDDTDYINKNSNDTIPEF